MGLGILDLPGPTNIHHSHLSHLFGRLKTDCHCRRLALYRLLERQGEDAQRVYGLMTQTLNRSFPL